MRRTHKAIWYGVTILAVLAAAGVSIALSVPEIKWRAQIITLKAKGNISDLDWSELIVMLQPSSGYYIKSILNTKNPYTAIRNPFTSNTDIDSGEKIFRLNCSQCHGSDGHGDSATDFSDDNFRHGESDWALFRNITRGILNTAMPPHDMADEEVWRLVAYIRSITAPNQKDALDTLTDTNTHKPVTADRLLHSGSEPENWLSYSGTFDSRRYRQLDQINQGNISSLRLAWVFQTGNQNDLNETSPLVVDGVMFLTEPPNTVLAVDAVTGREIWKYVRKLPEKLSLCCGMVNRGVAILDNKIFLGTLDAHLVALDSRTGEVIWDVETADHLDGYSNTAAPLAIRDQIIVGVAGGEYGIRGFLDAYDADTGDRLWRFNTIPGAGSAGNETWPGDSWKTGGGPTWMTGSYDPELNLVYWGVGNPSPDFFGDLREGDNLYTNSVVAINADTGELQWHFQFTPHDVHDYDANHVPVLVDAVFEGKMRKLLVMATKNAFFYVLDRQTGEFLLAKAFAHQTWAKEIDAKGRPVRDPNKNPSVKGTLVYPSSGGATNWWPPSYNPNTGLYYLSALEAGSYFFNQEVEFSEGELFTGSAATFVGGDSGAHNMLRAIDILTGEIRWEFNGSDRIKWGRSGGSFTTSSNLVFWGDYTDLIALNAVTGTELWRRNLGGKIIAAPITYAIDGRQYVTIAAGRNIFSFVLDQR